MEAIEKEVVAGASGLQDLPEGWSWVRLGDVCDAVNGRAFKSTEWRESGLPIIRIQNLKDPEAEFNYFDGELDERHRVRSGDLLFAWSGTPGTSFGAHIWKGPEAALNQHIFNIKFDVEQLDSRFFCLALNQNVSRYVAQAQGGVGLAHITKSKFLDSFVPIAPREKQLVIVAEIEKQFSRLDEAVANLKRVKANLKHYKAAILKAAVEGGLVSTEADLARQEGRRYETGEQLLKRILVSRRKLWKGKSRYQEPGQPDQSLLPRLPAGWCWARLDAVAAIKGGLTVDKNRKDPTARPVPYLRVANVQRGYLDLDEVKLIEAPEADIEELRLQPGDILFNEGGDRDKLGRGWIWEGQLPECLHQNHVFRVRLYSDAMSNKLISWWGNTFGKDYFQREGKQTTNLASINLTKLAAFPVPVAPTIEQSRIVREIERLLSVTAEVENAITRDAALAERLRRATLASALSTASTPRS